jgi:hypothetical protein
VRYGSKFLSKIKRFMEVNIEMVIAIALLSFVAGSLIGLGIGTFVAKSEYEYRYFEDDYD